MKALILAFTMSVLLPLVSFGQGLPAMPDCKDVASPKLRSEKIETYVEQIEAAVGANAELLKAEEYTNAVKLVAAYLLPEETMFRRFETECWTFFEEGRQALKNGKTSVAKEQTARWQVCLKHRDDEALTAMAEPLVLCLAPVSTPKATKK